MKFYWRTISKPFRYSSGMTKKVKKSQTDGTFLHAVNQTNFSKDKVYVGVHTGTLGFLQNLSESDIYTLIKYLSYEEEINTRKVPIPCICVVLSDSTTLNYKAFNEILVCGKDYTKIQFSEYIDGEFFQDINKLEIATYSKVQVIREKILGYKY